MFNNDAELWNEREALKAVREVVMPSMKDDEDGGIELSWSHWMVIVGTVVIVLELCWISTLLPFGELQNSNQTRNVKTRPKVS